MELIVGENTYMSLDEANEIINSRYRSNSNIKKIWTELNDEDKTITILSVTERFDNRYMFYKGDKLSKDQKLQFPRVINNMTFECPFSIKHGLLLQAIREIEDEQSEEIQLKNKGVKSFADGTGAKIDFETTTKNKNQLDMYSDIWNKYFSEWSLLV